MKKIILLSGICAVAFNATIGMAVNEMCEKIRLQCAVRCTCVMKNDRYECPSAEALKCFNEECQPRFKSCEDTINNTDPDFLY